MEYELTKRISQVDPLCALCVRIKEIQVNFCMSNLSEIEFNDSILDISYASNQYYFSIVKERSLEDLYDNINGFLPLNSKTFWLFSELILKLKNFVLVKNYYFLSWYFV